MKNKRKWITSTRVVLRAKKDGLFIPKAALPWWCDGRIYDHRNVDDRESERMTKQSK